MEEMVEVRKEVSDMPCGNAIPAEDAGHQTEKKMLLAVKNKVTVFPPPR